MKQEITQNNAQVQASIKAVNDSVQAQLEAMMVILKTLQPVQSAE
jgi:hypothetical protein